ncbi:MAG: hypothetical protein ACKUBY_00955 [Candidatus Moraniibacteriota bacterium]|jgi:hypothetical protein
MSKKKAVMEIDGLALIQITNGFEVHATVSDDVIAESRALKDMVNMRGAGGRHVCMIRNGKTLCFQSSDFTPLTEDAAKAIFADVGYYCIPKIEKELHFKKLKRQIRDTLNKCSDKKKIESIAAILSIQSDYRAVIRGDCVMEQKGYRTVTVKSVDGGENSISVNFEELVVSINMTKEWLQKKDINLRDIVPEVLMYIKGNNGNEDVDLLGAGPLQDIILYSA